MFQLRYDGVSESQDGESSVSPKAKAKGLGRPEWHQLRYVAHYASLCFTTLHYASPCFAYFLCLVFRMAQKHARCYNCCSKQCIYGTSIVHRHTALRRRSAQCCTAASWDFVVWVPGLARTAAVGELGLCPEA